MTYDPEHELMMMLSAEIQKELDLNILVCFTSESDRLNCFREDYPEEEYPFFFDLTRFNGTVLFDDIPKWCQENLKHPWIIERDCLLGIQDQKDATKFKLYWI